jgi:hypothetical protein
MDAYFALFAALFVNMRTLDNRERTFAGRQWNRASQEHRLVCDKTRFVIPIMPSGQLRSVETLSY